MRLRTPPSRLIRDQRGQAAILFGLVAVPLIGFAGAAIDYSRATTLDSRLQAAIDATVLLAARQGMKTTDADLRAFAERTFNAQINDPNAKLDSLTFNAKRTELTGTASGTSPNTLGAVVGFASFKVQAQAKAVVNNSTYEIAVVLDNSGSMAQSASGGSKLYFAQNAANRLIDAMLASGSLAADRTKMSVVPFSLAVQVGNQYAGASWVDNNSRDGQHSSIHWQDMDPNDSGYGSSSKPKSRFDLFSWMNTSWRGCFESRPGALGTNDTFTSGDKDSYFVPMFAPDEPGEAGDTSTVIKYKNAGGNTTANYPNSYLGDNPATCTGGDQTDSKTYDRAQKKVCKYRNNPVAVTSYGRGPNYMCNSGPLLRLTDGTAALHASVNAMVADGSTNLLDGFMWGWRTLSPNLPFGDAKPYATLNNKKIIILMTDGMNSWSSVYNHNLSQYSPFGYYGDARLGPAITTMDAARQQIDAKTLEACTNFKAKVSNAGTGAEPDAIIYTVGFSTSSGPIDAGGLALLRDCATQQTDADKAANRRYAYVATTGDEIVAVFEDIARSIGGLRLAQ